MEVILKIWAANRPGVLDRIAGLIRRKGWNISSMTAGDSEEGVSQINLSINGRNVSAQALGEHLDELDGVRSWEECLPQTHVIREMAVLRIREERDIQPEGCRVVERRDGLVFYEYTGTPAQVDTLLGKLRGRMESCARTGPLVLALEDENAGG